ncbi:hypothetical protein Poli38472_011678 [Pythium oligandrum]|uniref:Uncharacterized protein n=1 Tax=Pythium oligandrum TaxID=41045 RepID=A0A8K1C7W4_PYTOL|nr:hypothetical protein Poli38472_011678 [Pythium oligandrum]|eukprot:TMW58090.1 hypothetical protein Poli38472_011678 [Pythium oligandrum]
MWQGIAETQMDQRQRSEAENAKLRVMLDEQIRLMKSLERQVVKNRSTVELLSWKLPAGPKRGLRACGKPSPLDTASIELDMQKTVLEMLGQVDRVVMDARFQDVVAGEVLQKTECHTDKRDGIVVEAMEARMLPADCQASAKALWNLLTRHTTPHKTMVHEDIQTGDKTVRRVFEALLDFPKVTGHFRAKLIHQFFYARDRVVILTHALMDPMQINDKPIDGLFTRTRQWHVLESANISGDQPATLLRMYYVSTPHIFDQKMPTSARRQGLGILSNFLMQSAPVYSSIHRQMLENRLMEDLLGMNMCL